MASKPVYGPPETRRMKAGKVRLGPGEEIGEHLTKDREEIIIVLKGTASLIMDGKSIEVQEGETQFIEEGKKHNVMNSGKEDLEYVYVVCLL